MKEYRPRPRCPPTYLYGMRLTGRTDNGNNNEEVNNIKND